MNSLTLWILLPFYIYIPIPFIHTINPSGTGRKWMLSSTYVTGSDSKSAYNAIHNFRYKELMDLYIHTCIWWIIGGVICLLIVVDYDAISGFVAMYIGHK